MILIRSTAYLFQCLQQQWARLVLAHAVSRRVAVLAPCDVATPRFQTVPDAMKGGRKERHAIHEKGRFCLPKQDSDCLFGVIRRIAVSDI